MKRINITIIISYFLCFYCYAYSINNELWQALINSNKQLAIDLLQQGADINALNEQGLAPIHYFTDLSDEATIKWLYENGANLNSIDQEGCTPIFYATKNGDYQIAYILMLLGAKTEITNKEGVTPREIAEQIGSKFLLELFDNPNSYSTRLTTKALTIDIQKAVQQGDWNKAIKLANNEIKLASKEWTKTSPNYTQGIINMGMIYTYMGQYNEAEKYLKKNIYYWEKVAPNSEQYYLSLTILAHLYREMNRYNESLSLYKTCLKSESSFTGAHLLWQIYFNIASVYTQLGKYDFAEENFHKSLRYVQECPVSQRDQIWCVTMANFAIMYYYKSTPDSMRKYAEMLYEVLEIMENKKIYDLNYIRFKQQLCIYEMEYGSILKAEEGINELLQVTLGLLGIEHEDYLSALNIASQISLKQSKYAQAYTFLSEALEVITRSHPNNSTKIEWAIISNWAKLVDAIITDESTLWAHEYAYNKSLEIYGDETVYYLQQVDEMGIFLHDIVNQPESALPFLQKAYNKRIKLYGQNNLNTIVSEYNLWNTYAAIPQKRDSAYFYLQQNDSRIRTYIQNMFGIMSELQRESFWEQNFGAIYAVTRSSFLIDYATINPTAVGDLYNDVLFTRGLLLNSSKNFNYVVEYSKDSLLQNKWQQLLNLKTILYTSQTINHKDQNDLEQKKEQIEREIMLSSDEYQLIDEHINVRWEDVRNALKDKEIAIEFIISGINHWGQIEEESDSVMYYALLLKNDYDYPLLVPLFERDDLNYFYSNGNNHSMYNYDIHQNVAYSLILGEIEPYIQDCKTIYFSPTHVLSQIALEALPITRDSILGDYYTLHRLTSTREITKKSYSNQVNKATLYGGIYYDVSSSDMLTESERYLNMNRDSTCTREYIDTINRGTILYLPGTKQEIERIEHELNVAQCQSLTLSGNAANEESFIALSGQNNDIIHLATHGFFWDEDEANEQDVFKQNDKNIVDPLSRCGLLLAGANTALQGNALELPMGVEDGILTAREISAIDLSGCDLAVLSACATGVGEYSNDGTIGLQRAFKMAGVQTIIMSLWNVNDQATQMLMTEFYTNWISKNQSKREAFKNAQNTVRAKFEEPEYWAGFILLD